MRVPPAWLAFTLTVPLLACEEAPESFGEERGDAGDGVAYPDATSMEPGPTDVGLSDGGETASATPLTLEWTPCPEILGQTLPKLECGRGRVPLDHEGVTDERIDLFVRRLPGTAPDGRFVVLLSGGPGFDGASLLGLATMLLDADPGLTAYLLDHRGTGQSTRLGCTDAESPVSPAGAVYTEEEWVACGRTLLAEWGPGLRHFNPSQAAHDVAALVAAERNDGEAAFVLGVSYGTFLAARYLALYPEQADGVIFDSVCPPGRCFLDEQDGWENEVARLFFTEACGGSPACAERMGADPWQTVADLHEKLNNGHCPLFGPPGPGNAATLRSVTAQLLMQADLRSALPALLYRIDRCSPDDIAALQTFFSGGGGGGVGPDYSFPLAITAAAQAMWSPAATSSTALVSALDNLLVARGVSAQASVQIAGWPQLNPREDRYQLPRPGPVPTLVVQAALDPATPLQIATPLIEALAPGPYARSVIIPHGSHNAIMQSRRLTDPQRRCGVEAVTAFMAKPRAELDIDCESDSLYPNFAGTPEYAQALFGRDSIWD